MKTFAFEQWCDRPQLPTVTRDFLVHLRSSPPARRVQGRLLNVSGTYASQKMGVSIQFESHTVELWAIYTMEHDTQVLEFFDQPHQLELHYHGPSGRPTEARHTPDFLVLRTDGAFFEEWKLEGKLLELMVTHPGRYQRDGNGTWRCPPGEAAAASLGLSYVYNLLGNTQASKVARQMTKAVNPKNQAVWQLPDLYDFLCEWAYEVYDQETHPALLQSPREAWEAGLDVGEQREHRRIRYDEAFQVLTLPDSPRETALVSRNHGIQFHYLLYGNDVFASAGVVGTKVPLCFDPFGISHVYALIHNHWVEDAKGTRMCADARSGEAEFQYADEQNSYLSNLASMPTFVPKQSNPAPAIPSMPSAEDATANQKTRQPRTRVGEPSPRRDQVGTAQLKGESTHCSFSGLIRLEAVRLLEAMVHEVQCPMCASLSKARVKGQSVMISPHPPRKSRPMRNVTRWMEQGVEWILVQKKG